MITFRTILITAVILWIINWSNFNCENFTAEVIRNYTNHIIIVNKCYSSTWSNFIPNFNQLIFQYLILYLTIDTYLSYIILYIFYILFILYYFCWLRQNCFIPIVNIFYFLCLNISFQPLYSCLTITASFATLFPPISFQCNFQF